MNKIMRTIYIIVLTLFLMTLYFAINQLTLYANETINSSHNPRYKSLNDIPGITTEEKNKIKALQESTTHFSYVMPLSTEAFYDENGDASGFAAYTCEWLEEIFGIPFKLQIKNLPEIFIGLEDGTVDFTGELTATPARQEIYYMTDSIAERMVGIFRLRGSQSFEEISSKRKLKLGFVTGSNTINSVINEFSEGTYEIVFIDDISDVYEQLKTAEMDAFFYSTPAEIHFNGHDDIVMENFFPVILRPVSLSTYNTEYKVIIDVVNKILYDDGNLYLADIYAKGYEDYQRNKLMAVLTDEERALINNGRIIKYVSQYDNYPLCFYNAHEKEWQGIAVDILAEITSLTGLEFEMISNQKTTWVDALKMLLNGEADMVAELIYSGERSNRFIWPETPILTDNFAFISRTDMPYMNVNNVLHSNVGVISGTVHADVYHQWFSDSKIFQYNDYQEAITALDKAEIDLLLTNQKQMLLLTNFHEMTGYKINFIINYSYESKFGFNSNETILAGIIDKCLKIIDPEIAERWMRKGYDYRLKMAEEQAYQQSRWLLIVVVLLLIVIFITIIFYIYWRNNEKRLLNLVTEKTSEITMETSRLQTIFDTIPDILFCMDTNLRYLKVNKSMGKHFGFNEAEAIGKTDHEILQLSKDVIDQLDEMNRYVISEEKPVIFEETIPKKSGEEFIFETRKVPLIYDGKVSGLMGIARDITKRKAMEEEALSASRLKSSFLANMSHELRTPLNVIIGLTELSLEEEKLTESIETNLRNIGSAGRTLLSIVNDILDISKIESGRLELLPIDYDTPSMLNDIAILTNTYIGEKPLDFKIMITEDLLARMYGDELRIKEIFTNLLSNAVKYTHEGEICLQVKSEIKEDFVLLKVTIKDTGVGIKDEDIKGLFSDYYQADSHTNRNIGGTGLGLSITKKLVEMMDGEISVESEYGRGSCFSFTIKQGFINENTIGIDIAHSLRDFKYSDNRHVESRKINRMDLSNARVLVVDDMPNNLDVAAGFMKKYKIQVDCLMSGQAAIERIKAKEPLYDAIFMDHMMPGMDGIETTVKIRALGSKYATEIPIIALTANAVYGAKELFFESGFQDFLPKPIDLKQMDVILKKWIRDFKMEDKEITDNCEDVKMKKALNDIKGIDYKKAMMMYEDDNEMLGMIVESFATHIPESLAKMEAIFAEVKASDDVSELLDEFGIMAHGVKGSASNIAAEEVREIAYEMEKAAKGGDLSKCEELYPFFMKCVKDLLNEIS